MSFSAFKSYWQNNTTLQTALPVNKIYVDFVPSNLTGTAISYPYARFTVLGSTVQHTTSGIGYKVVSLSYQLDLFNTDLDALLTLASTVQAQLDYAIFDDRSLGNVPSADAFPIGENEDNKYTYHVRLEYVWMYND